MATLLTKGLIVAGGIAGASATVGGIYYLTSKKEAISDSQDKEIPSTPSPSTVAKDKLISKLLKGKELLTESDEDSAKWNDALKLFEVAHTSIEPKAPWIFENWKVGVTATSNLESFKKQCLKLNKEKVSGENDPVYLAVEKYCTKEETAKQAGDV